MYIKKILWAVALIGLVAMGGMAYYIYNAMFVSNTAFKQDSMVVTIPSNSSYNQVRNILIPLLNDIDSFDALAAQKKYSSNVRAGRYRIKKGMNNNDIINTIRSQNIPLLVSFNNQASIYHLAGRIGAQIEADSVDLVKEMTNSKIQEQYGFNSATALGMYLPNSYKFFWNTKAEEFVERMHAEYKKYWTDERLQKAENLKLSPNEVITLASIVYEESKVKSEQPIVAGVYLNRLKLGMPLQADPTIRFAAYQLPEYENTVIRRVLNKHKKIDSPYNTYMYQGLPPGLIAMPDMSAVEAVLNRAQHDYLYFVADAEKIGYHKFAKSLRQHNKNAREYHRYLNKQGIRK